MKAKIFSYYLYFVFLTTILSLSANEQNEIQIHISEVELQEIFNNPDRSYVYVGNEVSDIADVIAEISKFDDNKDSFLWGLRNHIEKGFVIGNYEAVVQALEQAELVLRNKVSLSDENKANDLSRSLNNIIEQVIEEKLTLNAELLAFLRDKVDGVENVTQRSGLRLLVINEKIDVLGRAKFKKDVVFKDHVEFEHFVKFDGNVKFAQNVTIEGTLSAADEVVGCDLTVGCNISLNDSVSTSIGNIIKNGTPFIHNFGANNTFVGDGAGNFTLTGIRNTGFGVSSLSAVTTGGANTAMGVGALQNNTDGSDNTAMGNNALLSNSTGYSNTAMGGNALVNNTIGIANTAIGEVAMQNNVVGSYNTALGNGALFTNVTGGTNTAIGQAALGGLTTGNNNIALGDGAGNALTSSESNDIYIGNAGVVGESNIIRIGTVGTQTEAFMAGIHGTTTGLAAITVLVDANGQLGTISSTRRVKHDIQDMSTDSAFIYKLRPVTFVYNGDASETKQYGLIAEEVNEVFPTIVVHDENGQPYTVQYHVLPALILNELQKLAARVEALEARS
ncbi:MAG TPA: tail fiber domain-containing protein [Candidatus Babeliales bacterium]|jgi:hypothetical protein|nr:tail fiber domain-containing protein [Candidatus Babeliales bacterium]